MRGWASEDGILEQVDQVHGARCDGFDVNCVGYDDLTDQEFFQAGQKAVRALEIEVHLRNQHEVDILPGQGGRGRAKKTCAAFPS